MLAATNLKFVALRGMSLIRKGSGSVKHARLWTTCHILVLASYLFVDAVPESSLTLKTYQQQIGGVASIGGPNSNVFYSFMLHKPWGSLPIENANCCPYAALPLQSSQKPTPNIVFIPGVQKGGTTWLFHMLSQNPAMSIAYTKTLINKYNRKTKRFEKQAAKIKEHAFFNEFAITSSLLEDYYNTFPNNSKILLDGSPDYVDSPTAACRIRSLFPNAKFIIMLKDPVQRAFSAWHMMRTFLNLTQDDFETHIANEMSFLKASGCLFNQTRNQGTAVKNWNQCYQCVFLSSCTSLMSKTQPPPTISKWCSMFNFVGKGMYAAQLAWWLALYPPSQLHVLNHYDLTQDPFNTYNGILRFLGLPTMEQTAFTELSGQADTFHISKNISRMLAYKEVFDSLYDFYSVHNQQLYSLLKEIGAPRFTPFAVSFHQLVAAEEALAGVQAVTANWAGIGASRDTQMGK